MGEIAFYADILVQKAVNRALIAVDTKHHGYQNKIHPTAIRPAGNDFGEGCDGFLEPAKIALTMITQGDLHNHLSNRGYFSIGNARVITGHDAGFFQFA